MRFFASLRLKRRSWNRLGLWLTLITFTGCAGHSAKSPETPAPGSRKSRIAPADATPMEQVAQV
ncbi:MAG: hypothetical protein OEW39_15740, partial [Deltaproteobacteria bacterium]|nr:hypothetical protein [Deltaproteobacteria bacterium]